LPDANDMVGLLAAYRSNVKMPSFWMFWRGFLSDPAHKAMGPEQSESQS
jgi:hypothetical protein